MTNKILICLVFVTQLFCGCALLQHRAQIKAGAAYVSAPPDNGSPATLNTAETKTSFVVPKETVFKTTKVDAVAATQTAPGVPSQTVTEWKFAEPTKFEQVAAAIVANTGTVDSSVAIRKADNQARGPLLYAAILSMVAAGVLVYLHFPTPALCAAGSAVVFFLAYQAAGLPPWFWGVGVAGLAIGAGIYFGYERRHKEALAEQAPNAGAPLVSTPSVAVK